MEIQEADVRREVRVQMGEEAYFLYCDVVEQVVPQLVKICQGTSIEVFRTVYFNTIDSQTKLMRTRNPMVRERAQSMMVVAHAVYQVVEQLAGKPAMNIPYTLPGPDS